MIIVIAIFLFFSFLIVTLAYVIRGRSKAINYAEKVLLDPLDERALSRAISMLRGFQDEESREMVRRLIAARKQAKPGPNA